MTSRYGDSLTGSEAWNSLTQTSNAKEEWSVKMRSSMCTGRRKRNRNTVHE